MLITQIHEHMEWAQDRQQQLRQDVQDAQFTQARIAQQMGLVLNRIGSQLTTWGRQLQESQKPSQLLGNPQ